MLGRRVREDTPTAPNVKAKTLSSTLMMMELPAIQRCDDDDFLFPHEVYLTDLFDAARMMEKGQNPSVAWSVMATAKQKRAQAREVPAWEHMNSPGFANAKAKEVAGIVDEKDPSVRLVKEDDAVDVVPMRFVCTWKMLPDGSWVPKARLVAIGFHDSEKHELDVEADTPARETTRILFHTFVQLQWRLSKWDSKQAFLGSGKQRSWKRRVCLRPPKEVGLPPGYVWEALRAIYG